MFEDRCCGVKFFFERNQYENMTYSEKPRTQHRVPGTGEENIEMERLYRAGVATPVSGKNFVIGTKEKHSATK